MYFTKVQSQQRLHGVVNVTSTQFLLASRQVMTIRPSHQPSDTATKALLFRFPLTWLDVILVLGPLDCSPVLELQGTISHHDSVLDFFTLGFSLFLSSPHTVHWLRWAGAAPESGLSSLLFPYSQEKVNPSQPRKTAAVSTLIVVSLWGL